MDRGKLFGGVLFIAIVVAAMIYWSNLEYNRVVKWCTDRQYTVLEVQKPWFDTGPFWFLDEDETIYRVRLRDNDTDEVRISYFRVGFSLEQAWADDPQ